MAQENHKKNKYSDYFASTEVNDNFGTIFDSMCKCKKYQELSIGAKHFYTLCRVEWKSELGRQSLYKFRREHGIEDKGKDNEFVFPAKHMKMYGVDRSNGSRYLKQLKEAGFIGIASFNKSRWKENVYYFDSKWKDK